MNAQLAERPSTELAMLPPAERAQSVLRSDDLAPKLIALAKESQHITTITNPAGRDQCHTKRMVLKNERIDLEKRGKGAREEATAFSKAIIAEENRLIGIIKSEEDRLATLQGAWDAKIEAEKEAERQRIQAAAEALRVRLDGIRTAAVVCIGMSASDIAGELRKLETLDLSDLADDQVRIFEAARTVSIAQLGDMYADKVGAEQEAQRLAEQRAELDREREAQEAERARLDKIAEDERAELIAISTILGGCIGRSADDIGVALDDLRDDPPVNPTEAVAATYAQAIQKLIGLRTDALQREAQQRRDSEAKADRERVDAIKRRIDDIRQLAREAVGKSTDAIAQLLTDLEATPAFEPELNADAVAAQDATRIELRRLYGEAEVRERQDAEFRAQVKADADRKAQEAATKRDADEKAEREAAELAQAETQRLIAECTLLEAAVEALAFLDQNYNNTLAQQMLRSAIERAA